MRGITLVSHFCDTKSELHPDTGPITGFQKKFKCHISMPTNKLYDSTRRLFGTSECVNRERFK